MGILASVTNVPAVVKGSWLLLSKLLPLIMLCRVPMGQASSGEYIL